MARVGHVHAGVGRFENGARVDAAGIVRVEVDRDADLLAQRLHQFLGRIGLAQPGHVLDGEDVRAHPLQLLRHAHVVLQRVLVALGIEDVAGVADGGFADRVRLAHGLHGGLHVGQPVERIEDAEDVDALRGGFIDELRDDVVRVGGVADGVGGAQQHLEADVGHGVAQFAQARARVFVQEAHGDVEGGAAPHFQAEEVVQPVRDEVGDGQHVVGADARGQQRLVGVAERGVGDQQALLLRASTRRIPRARVSAAVGACRRAARCESCGGTGAVRTPRGLRACLPRAGCR